MEEETLSNHKTCHHTYTHTYRTNNRDGRGAATNPGSSDTARGWSERLTAASSLPATCAVRAGCARWRCERSTAEHAAAELQGARGHEGGWAATQGWECVGMYECGCEGRAVEFVQAKMGFLDCSQGSYEGGWATTQGWECVEMYECGCEGRAVEFVQANMGFLDCSQGSYESGWATA